jgi:hypothetical protein
MKLRFFQQVYFVSGLAPSLIAVLAGSLVHAQEAVESEESVRSRSPLLYVEAPVLVEDGVDPVMPLRARLASPELGPAFG